MRKWGALVLVIAACGDNNFASSDGGADAAIAIDAPALIDARADAAVDAHADAGVDAAIDAPPADARVPFCGDGVVDPGEQCDDGTVGTSADGCSSTCKAESEEWTRANAGVVLPPRASDFAATYDSDRGVIVRFGGREIEPHVQVFDTWEATNGSWKQIATATHPDINLDATFVYDPARHVSLYFGGGGPGEPTGETWQWDGTTWTQLFPAHSPPPRTLSAAVFDEQHGVVVLFGGVGDGVGFGDTWVWDGTDWSLVASDGPAARGEHALVYDSKRQRVLLISGNGLAGESFDRAVWAWDGASWTRLDGTELPGEFLYGVTATYDRARDRVVVVKSYGNDEADEVYEFNGATWTAVPTSALYPAFAMTGTTLVDTPDGVAFVGLQAVWTWDGDTWAIPEPDGPLPRLYTSLAYDPVRHRAVLFGGWFADGVLGDTWEWDGVSWIAMHPAHAPAVRYNAAITYDVARQRVVMSGGNDGVTDEGDDLPDTWAWDGTDWTQIATTHLPAAGPAVMAHDRRDGNDIRVSLSASNPTTFSLDASGWHDLTPADGLTGYIESVAYDEIRQRVVAVDTDHTFEWDGQSWTSLGAPPSTGDGLQLVYDPDRRRVTTLSGVQLWEWDGEVWSQRMSLPLLERFGSALAFDSQRSELIAFGGGGDDLDILYPEILGDTWIHRWVGLEPLERCDGTDADGDGLVDCADPDCWWSCTPTCPPLSSCP